MRGVTPGICADALESFIRTNFQVRDDDPYFDRDVSLWEEGYVDSTGVVEVITFLEETFEITITEAMLFSPDFTSISGMAKMVAGLKAVESSAGCSRQQEPVDREHASTGAK